MAEQKNTVVLVARGTRIQDPGVQEKSPQADELLGATPVASRALTLDTARSTTDDELVFMDEHELIELELEDNLQFITTAGRLRDEIGTSQTRTMDERQLVLPPRLTFHNHRMRGEDGLGIKAIRGLQLHGKLLDETAALGGRLAARHIAARLEEQLCGKDVLYRLVPEEDSGGKTDHLRTLSGAEEIDVSRPLLLFLHGTASSTSGSFSPLWDPEMARDDALWENLRKQYGKNIFAFEHRTLTHSPIDNLLRLLEQLPQSCNLHLVSHSRGGLIGELLCRGQFTNGREPFTTEEISLFREKTSRYSSLSLETRQDYHHHRDQLKELNDRLRNSNRQVERFVRVACPALGTTLASGKLDVYLSGILNVIGLVPALKKSSIYSFLRSFTLAVVKERANPEQFPGLEVMMPSSPFIHLLNSSPEPVNSSLAVIKGDIEPHGILKKISTFFLDRFYSTDHDLVVNTPSMEGGAKRQRAVSVLFDQGPEVNHFRYFANGRSRDGLMAALTTSKDQPDGYSQITSSSPIVTTKRAGERGDGSQPVVIVLPGLIGTHLSAAGDRVWVDIPELVTGGLKRLKYGSADIEPEAVVESAYGSLIDYLDRSHRVRTFPYDWRLSVLANGKLLANVVSSELEQTTGPVRIVAHSMGGLVVRGMMGEVPAVWQKMCERPGSRVLMLGTPCLGSHSTTRILAGQEGLVNLLALGDLHSTENELINLFSRFPGLLELLPVTEEGEAVIEPEMWDQFSEVMGSGWKKPTRKDLERVSRAWKKLLKVPLDPARVFYVAGFSPDTPSRVAIEDSFLFGKRIRFMKTASGDGRVTWEGGIPPNLQCWYVRAKHGDLPAYADGHEGYLQILEKGATDLLATSPPRLRESVIEAELVPDRVDLFPDENQLLMAGLGMERDPKRRKQLGRRKLAVSVIHCNLHHTCTPLAVGHYAGDTIVSAEAFLDKLLGGRLSRRQMSGVYPGPLYTSEVLFGQSGELNGFPGAIIVGLGEVGELAPGNLASTFRDAVIRYVLLGRESGRFPGEPVALSSLLIGTGAGELSIKDSVASLITGVIQANTILQSQQVGEDCLVSSFDILELYEDVAIEAQYSLCRFGRQSEFSEQIVVNDQLQVGKGGRKRPYFNEDDEWWQRLRIEVNEERGLRFTAFGGRARAEMREIALQQNAIDPFLNRLSGDTSIGNKAGRVLFEMLIPSDLKYQMRENQRLMLILDPRAASYPWEMLEYKGKGGEEPLAIKAGLIRQLATRRIRNSDICTDQSCLVIGDPDTGPRSEFSALPGAVDEAIAVSELLGQRGVEVRQELIRQPGEVNLAALMTQKVGILHLAGHGVVNHTTQRSGGGGQTDVSAGLEGHRVTGMAIGEDMYLTPAEIGQLPFTPSFVFLNCCHLGRIDGHENHFPNRYQLAANLAIQFIEQGVKAVIAAGWAVNDGAARLFATSFYESFLDGVNFGDAVRNARVAVYSRYPQFNTWGAYQCYGDPGYGFRNVHSTRNPSRFIRFVSLAEYVAAVKDIAEEGETASDLRLQFLENRLTMLEESLPDMYRGESSILLGLGEAWERVGNYQKAEGHLHTGLAADSGKGTIRLIQQLANLRSRNCLGRVYREEIGLKDGRQINREAIDLVQSLNERLGKSGARCATLAEIYRRQAVLDLNREPFQGAVQNMYRCSLEASRYSSEQGSPRPRTDQLNQVVAQWVLHLLGDDNISVDELRVNLERLGGLEIEVFRNVDDIWDGLLVELINVIYRLLHHSLSDKETEMLCTRFARIQQSNQARVKLQDGVEYLQSIEAFTRKFAHPQQEMVGKLLQYIKILGSTGG